ncbi:MAG: sulfotransferase family 2 domain-containing protein [Salinibacter sp.]
MFGDAFWSYYTFSFVRNPYTRLVSAYEYLRRGGHPAWPENQQFGEEVIESYEGFQPFVLQWLRPNRTEWPLPHFYPQTHFLTLDDQLAVDFLGHVETIEEDFATVCDHFGVEASLPQANATPGECDPLGGYYDSEVVMQRVQEVYRSDFERFGYSRDVPQAEKAPESR